MTSFKVTSIARERDWNSTQGGPMRSYYLMVEGQQGEVELSQKATTPPPTAGQVIEGTIEPNPNGTFPPKLKKAQQFGGGGGGSKDFKADPVKQAAIAMQASHNTALDYARFLNERGKLPDDFALLNLAQIADFFYARVKAAMAAAK